MKASAARESLGGGRYEIRGVLGEGTQGQTLEALDTRSRRVVAIKRFDVRGARAWKDVELAEREARVLASLSHPALPAYIEHFEEGGVLFLVMEKIDGESLATRKKAGLGFTEREATCLLEDAARVLGYLHGKRPPIVHRDIKPSNVIRRPDGSFALVDFGAVRDRMKPEGGSTVVGTFGYMAPEQFQGRALPASDVYALGATVLAMLSGAEPESLPHRGLSIDVAAALGGRASEAMVQTLKAMLEPDPDRRASSIAPLLGKLRGEAPRSTGGSAAAPAEAQAVPHKRSGASRILVAMMWAGYAIGWTSLWPIFGHSWIFAVVWALLATVLGRVGRKVANSVEGELALMRVARRGRDRADPRIRVEGARVDPRVRVAGAPGDVQEDEEEGRAPRQRHP